MNTESRRQGVMSRTLCSLEILGFERGRACSLQLGHPPGDRGVKPTPITISICPCLDHAPLKGCETTLTLAKRAGRDSTTQSPSQAAPQSSDLSARGIIIGELGKGRLQTGGMLRNVRICALPPLFPC